MFGDQLTALLEIARAAIPDVDRAFIAGGPVYAKNCHSLVVSPEIPTVINAAGPQILPGGSCVMIPQLTVRVTYVKDCYPVATENGATVDRPKPEAITAWTVDYADRVTQLLHALVDHSGDDPFGGRCGGYTIRPGSFNGPLSGICWTAVFVEILDGVTPS